MGCFFPSAIASLPSFLDLMFTPLPSFSFESSIEQLFGLRLIRIKWFTYLRWLCLATKHQLAGNKSNEMDFNSVFYNSWYIDRFRCLRPIVSWLLRCHEAKWHFVQRYNEMLRTSIKWYRQEIGIIATSRQKYDIEMNKWIDGWHQNHLYHNKNSWYLPTTYI